MKLEEIRKKIDRIDSEIKPLFIERMDCSKGVAEAKAETGGDVFVPEREAEVISKRSFDIDESIQEEYKLFLRNLMSVGRRYQYGILKEMQDTVVEAAMEKAGISETQEHTRIKIQFSCNPALVNFHLFADMAYLNQIEILELNMKTKEDKQIIVMTVKGNIKESNLRRLLCQIGKEAESFKILGVL